MNPFGDILQDRALVYVPRMADHDYVWDSKKAPGMNASDLKCIELRRFGLFQDSYSSTANGNIAPGPPRRCLEERHP